MLEPLDPEKLRALVGDDDNADYYDGGTARSFFAEDDFAEGMKNLLQVFNLWVPYVYHDKKDFTNWHIHFRVCVPCHASLDTDFNCRTPPLTPSISDPVAAPSRYSNMTDFSSHLGS